MKITNKYNAPDVIVKAVENDPYDNGGSDFTITQLIDSARISALRKIHDDTIEEDISDRRAALFGQIIHGILTRAADDRALVAKRFFSVLVGFTVSGEIDYFKDGVIQDWKFVGQMTFAKNNGVPINYKLQLNCLAYLMRKNGHTVTKLQSVPIYKDWTEYNAKRPNWFEVLEVPLMPDEVIEKYLLQRIKEHSEAIIELPVCTDEERWVRDAKYAVMKVDRKSAVRLLETEKLAKELAKALGAGHTVEYREGFTRCAKFCSVNRFCEQYQNSLKGKEKK